MGEYKEVRSDSTQSARALPAKQALDKVWTKVLAFLSSLIGASLPITGFIIWWNRKGFGKSKKSSRKTGNATAVGEAANGQAKPAFKPKPSKKETAS